MVALPEDAVELHLRLLARVNRRPVVDEHGRLDALPLGLVRAVGVRGGRDFRDGRVGGLDKGGLDDGDIRQEGARLVVARLLHLLDDKLLVRVADDHGPAAGLAAHARVQVARGPSAHLLKNDRWKVAVHVKLLRDRGYETAPGELAAHEVVQDLGLQAR